jgi:hypothetical protein
MIIFALHTNIVQLGLYPRRVHVAVGVEDTQGADEGFESGVDPWAGFAPGDAGGALVRRVEGVLEIGLQVPVDLVVLLLGEGGGESGGRFQGNQAFAIQRDGDAVLAQVVSGAVDNA